MLFNKLKEMFSEMILKKNADLIPHYYHYEFLLCANDIITNYNEFLDSNIKHYASNVEYQIEYDTETFLEEKDKIAGRIWLTTKKPNEPAKTIEVMLIAKYKDEKIYRLWGLTELTYPDWSKAQNK